MDNIMEKRRECRLWFPIRFTKYYVEQNNLSKDLELVVVRGLISKKIEKTKLYKVNDISYDRGVGNFFCGVANLTVHSADASTPALRVNKIRKAKKFMKFLEDTIATERQRLDVKYTETNIVK